MACACDADDDKNIMRKVFSMNDYKIGKAQINDGWAVLKMRWRKRQ